MLNEKVDHRIHSDLERASTFFYQQKLRDAYAIFKRYYDRLPFQPERDHLKYIGMFIRTLFELGKSRELEFYRTTLEKIYESSKSPEIGYQLAYFYLEGEQRNIKRCKELIESIINHAELAEFRNKAKVILAQCYDVLHGDTASVRFIIDSIDSSSDPKLKNLLVTWRAKLLRDEGKTSESEQMLLRFIHEVSLEDDWYSHITARVTLIYTLIKKGDLDRAKAELKTVRDLLGQRPIKSVQLHLALAEKKLESDQDLYQVTLRERGEKSWLILNGKTHLIKPDRRAELLLLRLLKEGFVSRDLAASVLLNKSAKKDGDANQIYAGIHSIRKLIEKIGLSRDSVRSGRDGYRFIPKVEFIRELGEEI